MTAPRISDPAIAANADPNLDLEGDAEPCDHCGRGSTCVCALLVPQATRHRVVVLQHPQEQDKALGSVPLLTRGLAGATVRVGLSWRNLADALGPGLEATPGGAPRAAGARGPGGPKHAARALGPGRWAVMYPASWPKAAKEAKVAAPAGPPRPHGAVLVDPRGRPLSPWPKLEGIVLLDGTWSQAKALWWRNPWLVKLPRLGLMAPPDSIYGRVRKEPKRGYLSTLEAAAAALEALGEPEAALKPLRRAFRTLVQRLRDGHEAAAAKMPAVRGRRRPKPHPKTP